MSTDAGLKLLHYGGTLISQIAKDPKGLRLLCYIEDVIMQRILDSAHNQEMQG